jgi:hypothetical protein
MWAGTSIIRTTHRGNQIAWEPRTSAGVMQRFKAVHSELDLSYTAVWRMSRSYGYVKTIRIWSGSTRRISIVDGIAGLVPTLRCRTQPDRRRRSRVLQSESDPRTSLALCAFSTGSLLREPAALPDAAATACQIGLHDPQILLSTMQLDAFRRGSMVAGESMVRYREGAYLIAAEIDLTARESFEWHLIVQPAQSRAGLLALLDELRERPESIIAGIAADFTHPALLHCPPPPAPAPPPVQMVVPRRRA